MKKNLLAIGLIGAIAFGLNAQTITSANQFPAHGDSITYKFVDMCESGGQYRYAWNPDGVQGTGNTDMKWDIRTRVSYGDQTTVYLDADSTIFNTDFPMATHGLFFDGSGPQNASCVDNDVSKANGYEIYRFSGDSISRLAFTSATEKVWWFENGNGFPRYIFPFSVNDTWSTSYKGHSKKISVEDSSLIENGSYTATVIGSGSLVLPSLKVNATSEDGEQIDNVVCVKVHETFDLNAYSTAIDSTVLVITQLALEEDYYAWFKEGVQEPIMIYYKTIEDKSGIGGNLDSTNVLKYQSMDGIDPTFLTTGEEIKPVLNVYPNPTNGLFNVNLSRADRAEDIKVYNSLGGLVANIPVSNRTGNQFQIDLSNQPKGIYLVKVTSGNREAIEKVVVK